MGNGRNDKPILTGFAAYIATLASGQNVSFRPRGNSMTPRIKSGQRVTFAPVKSEKGVSVGDVVFCRIGRNHYTHLVTARKLEGDVWRFQISNNHGRVNGWIGLESVFGVSIAIED